ncbi:hypothetical protein BT69DRAFT_1278601 [Atractiella rhizophila]|nr:hypothetical protein BT69DRAFT_1287686 [Atractiella rhizophila]KAH8925104.1 hypothetical protein BT69DRAFT_1279957 [Atractiella rhizophila]KAH8926679.1 hypothetical protein BT69DRAFT_1278601 [Atractiella rhizophila]
MRIERKDGKEAKAFSLKLGKPKYGDRFSWRCFNVVSRDMKVATATSNFVLDGGVSCPMNLSRCPGIKLMMTLSRGGKTGQSNDLRT